MAEVKITKRQQAKIEKAVEALNEVRREVQSKNQGNYINWYLEDNDNLLLMSDESHDEKGKHREDRVILHSYLNNASGGGW